VTGARCPTGRTTGRPTQWLALPVFALLVVAVAAVGGLAMRDTAVAYADLARPGWAPPGWLFGPVWAALYASIAVSGWLVWRRTGWTRAMWAYGVQLALNAAWSPLFFGAGRYGLAFLDIVGLWLSIGVTIALFGRISRAAAALLLPYWVWVAYAAALNLAIWRMNA